MGPGIRLEENCTFSPLETVWDQGAALRTKPQYWSTLPVLPESAWAADFREQQVSINLHLSSRNSDRSLQKVPTVQTWNTHPGLYFPPPPCVSDVGHALPPHF